MNELDYQLKVQKEVADELNLKEKIERLQEQLNEANEVVKLYADAMKQGYPNFDGTYTLDMAEIIDDKRIALSRTISDPRPADEYLEKWGVK